MHRRGLLALGATSVAATSGCLGVLSGEESARFEAGTATVSRAALEETGFQFAGQSDSTVEREFSAAGQSRTVEVINRVAEYDRSVSLAGQTIRGAVFTAVASPAVEVVGRTFNPLADATPTEIARRAVSQYDQIQNLERTATASAQLLSESAEVGVFEADATITEGVNVTVVLRVSEAVRAGSDFVVVVGGYPKAIPQADAIRRLTRGVEHTDEVVTLTESG